MFFGMIIELLKVLVRKYELNYYGERIIWMVYLMRF